MSSPVSVIPTPWSGRKYFLDKMSLREWVWATAAPKAFPRSETVFNLGYTGAESARFPWVATLSGLVPGSPVARRGRVE